MESGRKVKGYKEGSGGRGTCTMGSGGGGRRPWGELSPSFKGGWKALPVSQPTVHQPTVCQCL